MTDLNAPGLKDARAAISPDGETVLLTIMAANSQALTVRLSAQELSKMVTFLLATAGDAAVRQGHHSVVQKGLPAKSLPVQSLGVGPGNSESEAILAVRFGMLTLSFAVELKMLLGTCQDLQLLTRPKSNSAMKH